MSIARRAEPESIISELLKLALAFKKDNLANKNVLLEVDGFCREVVSWLGDEDKLTPDAISQLVQKIDEVATMQVVKREQADLLMAKLNGFIGEQAASISIIRDDIRRIREQQLERQRRRGKRIAFVDIDGTLIKSNGALNMQLIEELKQYDEVILFTQRNKWLQMTNVVSKLGAIEQDQPTPLFLTTEQVLIALRAHGVHGVRVSTSLDHTLGAPMEYYDQSLCQFDRVAYEAGLDYRENNDNKSPGYQRVVAEIKQENEAVRTALNVQTDIKTLEGQPGRYYPVDKVDQYLSLYEYCQAREDEPITVTMFDDVVENIAEIIDSPRVEHKPLGVFVDKLDMFSLPVKIQGVNDAKFINKLLANLGVFIDYLLEIKKRNAEHDQFSDIERNVDLIINQLLSIKSGAGVDSILGEIAIPLLKLSDINELIVADELKPVDLANAIVMHADASPKSRHFVATLRSELLPLSEYHMGFAIRNIKNMTLGEAMLEELLPETIEKLTQFVCALSSTPIDDQHFEIILEAYKPFLDMQKRMADAGFKDVAPGLMQSAIDQYTSNLNRKIVVNEHYYHQLMLLDQYLEKKENQARNKSQHNVSHYFQGLRMYLNGNGRLLDGFQDNIASPQEVNSFMEDLLKRNTLSSIPVLIENYYPNPVDRDAFNRQLYRYQVAHAYEIHQWQLDLRFPELEANVQTKMNECKVDPTKIPGKFKEKQPTDPELHHHFRRAELKHMRGELNVVGGEICEEFIKNIKTLIETTHWKARGIFGAKISLNGEMVKLPTNVAKIYEICQKATQDYAYIQHFNELAQIGLKASKPHKMDFFGLRRRDEATQDFYDQFKEAFTNMQKAKQSPSSS